MPLHDWTRVKSGTYHNFHYLWLAALSNRLNAGTLPPGLFAMAEQRVGGPEADVLTLSTTDPRPDFGGNGVATAPPRVAFTERAEKVRYARKTHRIAIHHDLGTVVAVIEVVSPGNKDTKAALRSFARKAGALIRAGVHLSVVDPFPPGRHDPDGIHPAVWAEVTTPEYRPPAGKPLTAVSYQAGQVPTAYVEPLAVGDPVPDMPLYLDQEHYVYVPLEETYRATWAVLPEQIRQLVEPTGNEAGPPGVAGGPG